MIRRCLFALAAVPLISIVAVGDEIKTTDGSVIYGEVVALTGGKLTFKTAFAGDIVIPWEQVAEIRTEKPLPIHMGEEGVLTATLRSPEAGRAEVISASEVVSGTVDLTRITDINPPPPPPVAWHGSVVVAYTQSTGNTENITGLLRADANRRTERDRLTFGALWNYKEDENELTERNAYFLGKYDYFITKRLFGYGNLRLETDEFKDLTLRTIVGAGLGYQFVETERANFFGEGGISYINENYDEAEDESFAAGRLAYSLRYWLIQDKLRFLHDLEWLVSFENSSDWLLNTDTGLRLKISDRWSANASVLFSYDNEPAPGTEEEDTIYALGLAYEF